ncbi:PREDICTED: NADH dehydrogenase [ubiquinone] 1 alpha subcomplex subunit 2 [Rhagoletis zephyria]|uniref:NADH dehydrogenase [ubiquinone] 1 alpha subcomplex subunit 2 n=1 Tax=Rhagoletis zephyria TaxID=28612 RepID=UPI0008114B19|nr:PREDICTED: NADH dehydrogenase [ubiquinone] 1 alpha subcomplex subunit 2 [Rhagoletis zephyria]
MCLACDLKRITIFLSKILTCLIKKFLFREFVEKFYPSLKKNNPDLPILIRECSGIQPRLWARFALGKETSVPLTNQSAPEIQKQLEAVTKT